MRLECTNSLSVRSYFCISNFNSIFFKFDRTSNEFFNGFSFSTYYITYSFQKKLFNYFHSIFFILFRFISSPIFFSLIHSSRISYFHFIIYLFVCLFVCSLVYFIIVPSIEISQTKPSQTKPINNKMKI